MKKQVLAVVGSLLFLTACGDNGSGGGSSAINPLAKPANPASAQYLTSVLEVLKRSGNLPGDEVIFKKTIDSFDVKNVSRNGAEYKAGYAKLNSVGRQLAENIQSKCKIQDATVTGSGTVAQGNTVVKTATMGTSGQNCPYIVSKKNNQSTLYTLVSGSYNNAQVKAVAEYSYSSGIVVNDARALKAAGIKSMNMDFKMTLNIDITKNNSQMVSRAGGPITGQMTLTLANGEQIKGPIEGSMSMDGAAEFDSSKTDMIARFTGTSPGGDVWFVMTANQGKTEIFLNGEKLNTSGRVKGLSLTDSVADELVESLKAL